MSKYRDEPRYPKVIVPIEDRAKQIFKKSAEHMVAEIVKEISKPKK